MKTIIQQMVDKYNPQNNEERKNAIKEKKLCKKLYYIV